MKAIRFKKGQRLEFNCYGIDKIVGKFIKIRKGLITILTEEDKIKDNIGKENTIHENHFVKILE